MAFDDNLQALFNRVPDLFRDATTGKFIWEPGQPVPIPRWAKSREEKKARTKKKAEVFTPAWIVDKMTGYLDDAYSDTDLTFLEITCGEAPFITTRYDPQSGAPIDEQYRNGVLDRKLRAIRDRGGSYDECIRALQSVYGYEYQEDSLMLARLNILNTIMENVPNSRMEECVDIIHRNFFQMDGLKNKIPGTDISPLVTFWTTGEVVEFEKIGKEY